MPKTITLTDSSTSIKYLRNKDKRLSKVIDMIGPICYTLHSDGFSFIVHEIIEQMLSIKAGQKIYSRLEELCSGEITPEAIYLLTEDEIKSVGTSSRKASNIKNLAHLVVTGDFDFTKLQGLNDDAISKELLTLPGIGVWTAKMYLMFVLDCQDILPFEDVAFLQSYEWLYKTNDRSKDTVIKKCKKWKPYSSIAARYLYRALDMGLTKNEFHLYK